MMRWIAVLAGLVVAGLPIRAAEKPTTAKPLVVSNPDWQPIEDEPLPPGALLRIGNSRARHGIASNIVAAADGKHLVAGFHDRAVRIWEAETGKLVRQFKPLAEPINAVAVSPDGKTIAVASHSSFRDYNKSIHLYDVAIASDKPRTLQGHTAQVLALEFSADGKTLLSGSYDKTARLWNVTEGKEIRNIDTDAYDGVVAIAFTREEKAFFTCSAAGKNRTLESREWPLHQEI